MKKFIKILLSILVVFFLLLLAIPFLFKGQIVSMIRQQVNENLNARVNFNDNISLSLIRNFPNLGIGIDDLSVAGINEFERDTLVRMASLNMSVDLMSVISGDQIKVRSVVIERPVVHAIILKDGKANWDISKPSA